MRRRAPNGVLRMSAHDQRRAELLADVEDQVSALLCRSGINADTAGFVAVGVADMLAKHWGGQVVSIPADHAYFRRRRDAEILARLTAANVGELAREFGIGERGLRKAAERARLRQRGAAERARLGERGGMQ